MPILRQESGTGAGRRLGLGAGPFTFGRHPECKFQLDDPKCSRRHAELVLEGGDYVLSDLGSSNGTCVNSVRITASVRLRDGDVFELGETRFRYVHEESAEPTQGIAPEDVVAALSEPLAPPTPADADMPEGARVADRPTELFPKPAAPVPRAEEPPPVPTPLAPTPQESPPPAPAAGPPQLPPRPKVPPVRPAATARLQRPPELAQASPAAGALEPAPPPPEPVEPPAPATPLPPPARPPVAAAVPPARPAPSPVRPTGAQSRPSTTIRRPWRPSVEQIQHARMTEFMRGVAERGGTRVTQYEELYDWSVREPQTFWASLWRYGDVRGNRGRRALVDGDKMPGARWFPDGEVSYAENVLRRTDDAPAIVFRREDGSRRVLTFAALRAEVGRLQAALRGAGVKPGDRVAASLPNAPEAAVAMLATASLGATWAACAPDLAPAEAAARLAPLEPRVLLGADGRLVGGERMDGIGPLKDLASALPSAERTVVLPYTGDAPDLAGVRAAVDWRTFVAGVAGDAGPPTFPRFPFDQPLLVLFPAGAAPVGVVHGAGGTLLQHLSELGLHADLRPGATLLVLATTSWMLWPWLVSALATGATVVLFDGHPFHPGPSALLDVARDERVSVLALPSRFLDAIERAGLRTEKPLPDLRVVLAAGAPVPPERYDTVTERVKADAQFSPMWGAPELISSFALGSPILSVRRGEIPCRALGMRLEVLGPEGRPVTGVSGELACRAPFPAMPLGLWGDADGTRYRAEFFSRHPGTWSQGDRCTLTAHGGLVVHARGEGPPPAETAK